MKIEALIRRDRAGRVPAFTIVLLVAMLIATAAPTFAQTPRTRPTEGNIIYVPDGNRRIQLLDVYLPENAEPSYPVVMTLHGSGGSRTQLALPREHFLQQGYAVVSVSYRYVNLDTAVADAFCALGWLYADAESYGFDTERVAVIGHSMGGWLGGLLATHDAPETFMTQCPDYTLPESERLQGMIAYAGVFFVPETISIDGDALVVSFSSVNTYNLRFPVAESITDPDAADTILETLNTVPVYEWDEMKVLAGEALAFFEQFSSGYWLSGNEPPILLIHGERDPNVLPIESELFFKAANAIGNDIERVTISDKGHEIVLFDNDQAPAADAAVDAFLQRIFEEAT